MSGRNIVFLAWLSVLPATILITGCNFSKSGKNGSDSQSIINDADKCIDLDQDACSKNTAKCEYLSYRTNPAAGHCVGKARTEITCKEVPVNLCELDGYLSIKCQKTIDNNGCEKFDEATKKSVHEVFLLSANIAGLSGEPLKVALQKFSKYYRLLSQEEKMALANEQEAGEFLIHRLAKAPSQESTQNVLQTYLSDLGTTARDQLANELGGQTALVMLTNAGRGHDDNAIRKQIIELLVTKGANIKKLPVANVATFLTSMNAETSKEKMKKYLRKIENTYGHAKAWIDYAIDKSNDATKGAVKEILADPSDSPELKAFLMNVLLKTMIDTDLATPVETPRTRLTNAINLSEWFDVEALQSATFKFSETDAPAKLPVALARYLKTKNANNPIVDVTYLSLINLALKNKLAGAWNDFAITDGAVADGIAETVFGNTPQEKSFIAQVVLHENVVMSIWNRIKNLSLTSPDNVNIINEELQKLFTISDPILRQEKIAQLMSMPPNETSGGLQLVNRIFGAPITPVTQGWFTTIFNNLPDADSGAPLNKKTWVEQVGNGISAITSLVFFRPQDPLADDDNAYKAILTLVSSVNPDVTATAMHAFKFITASDFANLGNGIRTRSWAMDKAIKPIMTIPVEGVALRQSIIRNLVTLRKNDGVGVIHKLFPGPVDQLLADAFSLMMADLENDEARKNWVNQENTGDNNRTVLNGLLVRPQEIPDVEPQLQRVINLVATAKPTVRTRDIDDVWAVLDNKNYRIEDDLNIALPILVRISRMPEGETRKAITINLVGGKIGGTEYQPRAYSEGNKFGLVQALSRAKTIFKIFAIYDSFIADQASPGDKTALLSQKLNNRRSAIKALTDYIYLDHSYVPGARLNEAFIMGGEPTAVHTNVIRLFVENKALDSIQGASADVNRANALFAAFMPPAPGASANWSDFIRLFAALDDQGKRWLADWAIADVNRAPAIKKIMDDGEDADKIALKSIMFQQAIYGDINTVVRTTHPVGNGVGRYALTKLSSLLQQRDAYGLSFDHTTLNYEIDLDTTGTAANVKQGSLIWMLMAAIEKDRSLNGAFSTSDNDRRSAALAVTVAESVKAIITGPQWNGYVNHQSTPSGESAIDMTKRLLGHDDVTADLVY